MSTFTQSRRPTISVLLPVYNAERHLEACLQSLAGQTYPDFEIVAVDDGSDDRSVELLRAFTAHDPRLRIVGLGRSGLIEALNTGIANCRGDFIARMDADDLAHPARLALQHDLLATNPQVDVASCRVEHFANGTVAEGFRQYDRWINSLLDDAAIKREIFIESPLPHPSVMLRRSLLEAVGGYQDNGWPEDYDLWLRMAHRGCVFSKLPQTLLRWRDRPNRLTRTDPRYAVERFLECKGHYLCIGPLRGRDSVVVWGAGQTGRRLSKYLLRGGASIESFIDIDPRKIGRTIRNRPIVAPETILEADPEPRDRPLVLAAVGSRGARRKIRNRLCAAGWQETRDFWCVA